MQLHCKVHDIHVKTALALVGRYRQILLPTFRTSEMVRRMTGHGPRRLAHSTAWAMLTWSHYRFQRLLLSICDSHGCELFLVTEEYTSKTCSGCGWMNANLGGAKEFNCPSCGLRLDRDVNGARNILIKNWGHLRGLG